MEAARESFGTVGLVEEHLDRLGEDVGSLPADLGFGVVTHAKLVHGPVVVEFGSTGVQQGYEIKADSPLSKKEEEEIEVPHEGLVEHLIGPESNVTQVEQCLSLPTETCGVVKEYPAGTYFLSLAGLGDHFGLTEEQEVCESGNIKAGTCKGRKTEVLQHYEGWTVPPGWERYETLVSEGYIGGGVYSGDLSRTKVVFVTKEALECGKAPSGHECTLLGLPAPGRLSAELEKHNGWNGLEAKAKESFTPHLTPLTEAELEGFSEEGATRSAIEGMFHEKGREEAEVGEQETEGAGGGNPGSPKPECYKGKPVNCATGNETQTQTDLSVGGRGPRLELTLTYNSQVAYGEGEFAKAGSFGHGWSSSFGAYVELTHGGQDAVVHQGNGSTLMFWQQGGEWLTRKVAQARLVSEGGGYVYTLPDQTAFHFNGSGQLTSEVDRNGNTLTMNRNSEGRLESVSDGAGRKITFTYDASGQVESATDPMGHTVKYTYDGGGNLASVTLPGEASPRWSYEYQSSHLMTSETDGRGFTTTMEYLEGKVVAQTDPLKRTRKWSYLTINGFQWGTKITEPDGSITEVDFNNWHHEPTLVQGAQGTPEQRTTMYYYTSSGLLSTVEGPEHHRTEYGYDALANRTLERNADGDETKWEYDSTYDVTAVTTPDGEKTTIERDSHGNPIKISRPAPGEATQVTKLKYDAHGDLESVVDPVGHEWGYECDTYGDRTAETDPEGNKRSWGYNEDSLVTSSVSPRGHVKGAKESSFTTSIERDAQGRVKLVSDPLKHETKYTYDGDGNLETRTGADGHTRTYTYDADDEPTKAEEPSKAVSETGYNEEGEVVSQTDGSKHTTKYERNLFGEVIEEIDPLKRATSKEYNEEGLLVKLTDPLGRSTTFAYDPAGRVTEVAYSDGKTPTVKYEYNGDGLRTKMTDGTGTSTYKYDQLDRLVESEDGHKEVVKAEYNLANVPVKITYPNGKAVTREYDKDSRLKSVTDWLAGTTSFAYNPDSELATISYPSATGDSDSFAYESDDAMSEAKMSKGSEVLASLLYARNKDVEVTKATTKGLPGEEAPEYSYDENSRLIKGAGTTYKYDPANKATTIGANTYSYNAADELEKAQNSAKTTIDTYTYNEAGQRTKTTPASGPATTYGYDQAGNLSTVTRPKEGETPAIEDSYAYNGEGLRTSETIGAATNYLAWSEIGTGLPSVLSNGTTSFVYGPGGMPIEQINNTTGAVLYLHHDQQGSTRLITGSTGKVEGKCSYSAYGTPTCEGAATTPLGYDGQYTSSDTGLVYLRNRVYDPATAQFLTVDPAVALTREPYAYGGDNPVNRRDPDGLSAEGLEGVPCYFPFCGPGAPTGTGAEEVIRGGLEKVEHGIESVWNAINENEGPNDEGEAELKEREAQRECGEPNRGSLEKLKQREIDRILDEAGTDAHTDKGETVGNAGREYDYYRDKETGEIYLVPKKGGEAIPTGYGQ